MINWEALPCSHRNCTENAAGIYFFSLGSECFEDPLQPLCEKHFIEARSPGPIETIVSRRTEMEDRKELAELRAELSRERKRLYQLRAEALKFENVREATAAYNDMLEVSQGLQAQLEDTRGIVREMLRFMGEASDGQPQSAYPQ